MNELPSLKNSKYMSNAYSADSWAALGIAPFQQGAAVNQWENNQWENARVGQFGLDAGGALGGGDVVAQFQAQALAAQRVVAKPRKVAKPKVSLMQRRIVQIFIVDPNENIPLADSLVYMTEKPFLTDLTDQELFYDIDIKSLLAVHNDKRTKIVDKTIKDRSECLPPVRVSGLNMNVTVVAEF